MSNKTASTRNNNMKKVRPLLGPFKKRNTNFGIYEKNHGRK